MVANKYVNGMEFADPPHLVRQVASSVQRARAPHTVLSSFKPGKVGDRVVVDLIGPVKMESLGKAKYIMLAKDSFSDNSHVYMLKTKNEVCDALQVH